MKFNPNPLPTSFFKKELVKFYFSQLEDVRAKRLEHPTQEIDEIILSLRSEILWLNQFVNECVLYKNVTQEM